MSTLPPHRLTEGYEPKSYLLEPNGPLAWIDTPTTLDNLEDLAHIIRTMTYGELTTLAEESGIDPRKLYGWSMK